MEGDEPTPAHRIEESMETASTGPVSSRPSRILVFVLLVGFTFLALLGSVLAAVAFPAADLTDAGPTRSLHGPWQATQLYLLFCLTVALPAALCSLAVPGLSLARSVGLPLSDRVAGGVLLRWARGTLLGCGLIAVLVATLSLRWLEISLAGLDVPALVLVLVALLFAALYEELLFRGFGFWGVERIAGPWPAVVLTSLLFAWAHADNWGASPLGLVNTTLAGVVLGVLRHRSGDLWVAWGVHYGWNVALGVLFGARTSGFVFEGRLLDAVRTEAGRGVPLISGGDYGPEASILLTVLLVAVIVALALRPRRASHPSTSG